MSYTSYDLDRLEAAEKLKIERHIYFESEKSDLAELTALPLAELIRQREESAAAEQAIFESLQAQATTWEAQAGKTLSIEKALEYARTPIATHTNNEWQQGDYDRFEISNAVYRMNYHVYENTRYDREKQESVPYSYTLTWSVYTNGSDRSRQVKIAGQDRKVFADKAAMEKYLAGRKKAYASLFTEVSPVIPKEYKSCFEVNGVLLPGYTVEGEEVKQRIAPAEQTKEAPKQEAVAPNEQTATQRPEEKKLTDTPQPVIPIVLTAEKPADKLKEITDRLEQGVSDLFNSGRYEEYLRVMSKFHNYSFNNTLLIAMQKPDASLVAGFSAWKNTFKRNVMKGQKGIKILAPAPFKIKQEMEKIDPVTQKPVIGRDGKPVTEEKEITIPAFKVVSVFDVSQTEGKELPSIAVDELTGDVDRYEDFFKALKETSPVPIAFEKISGGAHGYYHLEDKRIALDEGMSELQTLKTAIHEIAHAKLHDIDLNNPKQQENRVDRRTREVEAESVAYTVCQHYGLDTSDYSFGYVAGWSSGRELAELRSSLETIRNAAAEIIDSIDGNLAKIQKAKEKTQAQPEVETPVFEKLTAAQQTALSDTVKDTLQTLVNADMKAYGEVTQGTQEAIAAQGYTYHNGSLVKLTPDNLLTGEMVHSPRGNFHVTDMTKEQMEAAGYGLHHQTDDGKYFIMGNGTNAFAVAAQPENYLRSAELSTEQNENMIDGVINNTPTVDELEAKVKAGETISLVDLANAIQVEQTQGKTKARGEEKPSIRAQLKAAKEAQKKKAPAKTKHHELEV